MNRSMERRIDLSQRFKSGVLPYKQVALLGCEDTPNDSERLAVLRITPEHGGDPEEVARRVLDRDLDDRMDRPADG
jgi:hypothetical protein